MKERVIATYERESTLWKNANAFYRSQDWTTMVCKVIDFSEELESVKEYGIRFFDMNGNDVTDKEIERRYGRPYWVVLTNKAKTVDKLYDFATKEEANNFVKKVLGDKVLGNFRRVS